MASLGLQGIIICFILVRCFCSAEKVRYLSTERINLAYFSRNYFPFFNVTCHRYGRHDPLYYIGGSFETRYICYNNASVHFYFYEFLSNQYKRSFVEMHFLVCDLLKTADTFFGNIFMQGALKAGCPILAGKYHLYNLTVPLKNIPQNFPFTKGRIFLNMTSTDTQEVILRGHVDMEIKEFNFKQRKPRI